jgi:thiamine pyrophosphate-dependent acetolactate synthase large subunit-like protein
MAKLNRMQVSALPEPILDRRQAVPALIECPQDFLVIAGLAGAGQEMSAITGSGPGVFALAGAMGAAPMMGLGLALAQPRRRVLVVTGDGELLMNLGALATIALLNPPNLRIVCVDNGHYGETGNQDSHTGLGVQLDKIAAGAGFPVVHTINTEAEIAEGRRLLNADNGLAFVLLRVIEGPPLRSRRNLFPHIARDRFRTALLNSQRPEASPG